MSSHLLSLAGWTVLPNLATGWIQALYYGLMVRAGDPKPQPGSARFNLHRRRIHIIVVSAYLVFTIYEADWDIRRAGDYYQDLGVPITASERDIKSKFRRLAALHHPDKVTTNSISAQDYFVRLKLAQDTLLNPVKRFAYERFGPDMLECQRCSISRDYIVRGLQTIVPYYGAAAIFMYIFGFLGYLQFGTYWRWLTLICLCTFELHTISRPYFPSIATHLINPILGAFTNHPPYLPFQLILLARKLSITFFIALSQLGPLFMPPTATEGASPEAALKQQLDRLDATTKAIDIEANRLLNLQMTPFAQDKDSLDSMKCKIREWLVQNTIRMDPEVRDAMGRTLQKRRVDAPSGARGIR